MRLYREIRGNPRWNTTFILRTPLYASAFLYTSDFIRLHEFPVEAAGGWYVVHFEPLSIMYNIQDAG